MESITLPYYVLPALRSLWLGMYHKFCAELANILNGIHLSVLFCYLGMKCWLSARET